ncbi:MAG: shikimate dehydrogenase [Candidatus Sumerlaeaceae bacterium]
MSIHKNVSGRTRVVGVIGWPVEHSLSPPMHNGEFERLGLDYLYAPFAVAPENLEQAVRGLVALGAAGFNITIPHKQKIMPLLDEVSPEAVVVGAVNTVRIENGRTTGSNTDVPGWSEDIQQDILLQGSSVCVLGAGGAGRAICVAAALAGAKSVFIQNRTIESAEALASVLREQFADVCFSFGCDDETACRDQFGRCDIVVNTTPVGMAAIPGSPVPADWLNESQYVYDTIYTPAETELLRAAKVKGCPTRNGLGMLARQGALAFELWSGAKPDLTRMESTLRKALNA